MGDVKMAWAVNGIDLVVGGHSQNPACMKAENVLDRAYLPGTDCRLDRQNGTWVVQAHEWGKCVERADFEYRNGDCKRVPYALIPINLKKAVNARPIVQDPAMLGLLAPYPAFGQQQLGMTIGQSDARLEGERSIMHARPAAMGLLAGPITDK
jgi:5'-nucleotidase/UDP-sugar diphosphatase